MSSSNNRPQPGTEGQQVEPALDAEHYRRQLESVANNATLALFIMDEHQQCTYMNPAAEKLTGYRLAEVRGRALHDVIHHTRPDGRPFPIEECPIDRAFPKNMREQGEEVFVHRDGSFYPVAFTASPVREGDRTVGTIIEVRDIRREKELERQREELERAKVAFFSNVSHEFRTPLTLMVGPLEDMLAGRNGPLTEEQREQLQMILRNGLRLLKMVNTLLDFSRIEAGRMQAVYEPVDLAVYTRDLASLFRAAVERAGLHFVLDVEALPEPVYVDRDMWEKIVLNLLSNALKFTFQGEIGVSLRRAGDAVELVVWDSGSGIPAAELPHIFERFHRVKGARSRTHEGTGIGLALVQELVSLHRGTISVESAEGKGTTFRVRIPTGARHLPRERVASAQPVEATTRGAALFLEEALRWLPEEAPPGGKASALLPAPTAAESVARGPAVDLRSGGGRILLADDNADMRDYVRRLLRSRYEVVTVGDGEAALAAAREQVPDLILSDVMMPRMGGFELIRALRADPRTREVPVVLLSARAGEESRIEGLEAGADDYLTKPFSARELLARVGVHLEMARVRRSAKEEAEANERAQRFLAEASAAFTASLDYGTTLREIARRSVPILGDLCFFDVLTPEEAVERVGWAHVDPAKASLLESAPAFASRLADAPEQHPIRQVLRTGEPYLQPEVSDAWIEAISESPAHERFLRELAFQSWMTVPVIAHGQRFGALTFCYLAGTARRHSRNELRLAEELARRAAVAIENARLYQTAQAELVERRRVEEELRRLNETLEQRVAERTVALESTNTQLREEIAERARAEQALERTNAALRQSNRELQDFAYVASHDLQEPLRKISSFADLLREDCGTGVNEAGHSYIQRIQDAALRMSGLIRDLLSFSRVATQGEPFRPVDLNRILSEVLSDLEVRVAEVQGRVEVEPLPEIEADPTQMRQLFQNLVGNALKFHRPEVPPVIRVRSLPEESGSEGREMFNLVVEDNGIGFNEKYADRIFAPFQRLHGKGSQYEGTGMGLAICRHIAERHGGTIAVRSKEGEGATFIVTLPYRHPAPPSLPYAGSEAAPEAASNEVSERPRH